MIKLKKAPSFIGYHYIKPSGCWFRHLLSWSHYNSLMTNSISATVVEVTNNIHDTVIMPHDSQCQSQPHNRLTSFMSRCHNKDILNNVICIQNVIIERKTLNDSLMHTPSSKVLPNRVYYSIFQWCWSLFTRQWLTNMRARGHWFTVVHHSLHNESKWYNCLSVLNAKTPAQKI